jgi:hypothetical protein
MMSKVEFCPGYFCVGKSGRWVLKLLSISSRPHFHSHSIAQVAACSYELLLCPNSNHLFLHIEVGGDTVLISIIVELLVGRPKFLWLFYWDVEWQAWALKNEGGSRVLPFSGVKTCPNFQRAQASTTDDSFHFGRSLLSFCMWQW